jgi:hypothetical protein
MRQDLADWPRVWGRLAPTSQDSNTTEGLESRFSVGTHIIPAELPRSTKLGHGKLCRTREDFGSTFVLELL